MPADRAGAVPAGGTERVDGAAGAGGRGAVGRSVGSLLAAAVGVVCAVVPFVPVMLLIAPVVPGP
ncbi:hypothetical protein [Streptomyces sp. NPDC048516]|uniref:hypothetical protein n=1 Tax=Streptomyces sp. NPDC048516 TaxID=3365565 RepID=UPI0037137829